MMPLTQLRENIKIFIKDFLHKEYRLSVYTTRGNLRNFTGLHTPKEVCEKISQMPDILHYTVYKSGRFFIPEREINTYILIRDNEEEKNCGKCTECTCK